MVKSIKEEAATKEQAPLISVIVPVYNSQNYLKRSIESILAQSFQDFELILVNDGSSDNSPQICNSYSTGTHTNTGTNTGTCTVKVIHKENGGVSSARNCGIEKARGKYLAFVDSDDSVGPHYLKAFVDALEELPSIEKESGKRVGNSLIIQNIVEDSRKIESATLYPKRFIYRDEIDLAFLEYPIIAQHYSVCKLFHTQTVKERGIRFNQQVHFSEDMLFLFEYLTTVDSIFYLKESHYFRDYQVPGSLSKKWHPFQEQYHTYLLLKESTATLVEALQLNPKSEHTIYRALSTLSKFFKSLYHPQGEYSSKERRACLKELYNNQIEHLKNYPPFKENSFLKEVAT
ncbi:MAG: glycosyltransferase family 2 protein, partial [Bacteroidales bacterium]